MSLFSDILGCFNSSLRCYNFVQGTGVVLIIMFVVISLWSMASSTQVFINQKKSTNEVYLVILGTSRTRPGSSVLYNRGWEKDFWANLKTLEKFPVLRPHEIWSQRQNLVFFQQKSLNFWCCHNLSEQTFLFLTS